MNLPRASLYDPSNPPGRPGLAADAAWLAFLVWTAVGFVVMPLEIGESQVRAWISQPAVREAALALLHEADAVWILLAAIVVYFHAVDAEGLPTARRRGATILVSALIFEWIGTTTGYPFGPYRYTDRFGWRFGGVVPFAIPLAWLVILFAGRAAVLWVRPSSSRIELALGVALIALLTDCNLEYVAWKVRAYWIWYPAGDHPSTRWPPPQNYAAWFVLSAILAYALSSGRGSKISRPSAARPILVLILMNGLLAFVHLVHRMRFES